MKVKFFMNVTTHQDVRSDDVGIQDKFVTRNIQIRLILILLFSLQMKTRKQFNF